MLPALGYAALLALTVGCASTPASHQAVAAASGSQRIMVDARAITGVGTVLVTTSGYALYVFAPDNHATVTCTGVCLGTWPPLAITEGEDLVAGPGVKQSLLSSVPNPAGGRVVTYDGWPLYTYTGDVQPGEATGQNIDLNGGEWYVIAPSGQPVIPAP